MAAPLAFVALENGADPANHARRVGGSDQGPEVAVVLWATDAEGVDDLLQLAVAAKKDSRLVQCNALRSGQLWR